MQQSFNELYSKRLRCNQSSASAVVAAAVVAVAVAAGEAMTNQAIKE